MNVWIAGHDRSSELGNALSARASARACPELAQRLREVQSLLSLREAGSEREYLEGLTRDLWVNHAVETGRFAPAVAAGRGAALKGWLRQRLWRLLRYQHDWTTYQQNAVNLALACQVRSALEAQGALEARIAALEQREPPADGERAP